MAGPKLYLAQPIGDQVVPPLELVATEAFPDPTLLSFDEVRKHHDDQAQAIVKALRASLPLGTWDRVVGYAVLEHASLFVVNR
jgi:hypothetical protein